MLLPPTQQKPKNCANTTKPPLELLDKHPKNLTKTKKFCKTLLNHLSLDRFKTIKTTFYPNFRALRQNLAANSSKSFKKFHFYS